MSNKRGRVLGRRKESTEIVKMNLSFHKGGSEEEIMYAQGSQAVCYVYGERDQWRVEEMRGGQEFRCGGDVKQRQKENRCGEKTGSAHTVTWTSTICQSTYNVRQHAPHTSREREITRCHSFLSLF